MFVWVEFLQFPLFICVSLPLTSCYSALSVAIPLFSVAVIRKQMCCCHTLAAQVCVGGRMLLLPHYPLFYPFASALKHPHPLLLSSALFLSHR